MHLRVMTLFAGVLLLLCAGAWVRSYLPEYFTLRVHRGSLVFVFYGRQESRSIDPADNPASAQFRLDTDGILSGARRWAADPKADVPAKWRASDSS